MSAGLKKSWADLARRPGRTLLVMVGIAIGVFGWTAINTTEEHLAAAYTFSIGSQTTRPDLLIAVDHLDPALQGDLLAAPNVTAIQYATILQTQWHVTEAPGHVDMDLVSYPDLLHPTLTPVELLSGRYPGQGEIVMEFNDRATQAFQLGSVVTIDTSQGSTPLRVVGIARTAGVNTATMDAPRGYMSMAALQALPAYTDPATAPPLSALRIDHIEVKVRSVAQLNETASNLSHILQHHQVRVYGVEQPEPLLTSLQHSEGVFALLRIFATLAILLSGLLIVNTVTTLVNEQIAIIGLMKALGGTQRVILRGYLLTILIASLFATLPATLLGLVSGYWLASSLATSIPLAVGRFIVNPGIILVSLGIGLGVSFFAAAGPVWQGTRITVRQALAAYGISAGQSHPTRPGSRKGIGWISQTVCLGIRGTFRRRWRAALTLLMVTVAGISFLVVQIAATSINETIGSVWANTHADVELYTNGSLHQVQAELRSVANIRWMERYGSLGVQSPWGKLGVQAFDPTTQIYQPHLLSGRWFQPGDTNVILLGDDFAARVGLHAGDRIVVTSLGGNKTATWTVLGTLRARIDDLTQTGAGIIPVDTLNQFLAPPSSPPSADFTPKVLIQARDRSMQAVNQLAGQIDAVGRAAILSGSGERGAGIVEIFLFHGEQVRHQRNFFVFYVLLYAVALLIGIAGILGLASTLTASVVDRQREIGVLRSLGARSWQVGQIFWVEGLSLGTLAWCIGMIVGIPLALVFLGVLSTLVMPVDVVIDLMAFLAMVTALLLIASLASLAPAMRASRIRTAHLLRYE